MASTKDKYNQLNQTSSSLSDQLIFPVDYDTTVGEHPGNVVIFEINRVLGDKVAGGTNISGLQTKKNKIKGTTQEVDMYGIAGKASARNKTVADIGTGNIYKKTGESIVLPFPSNFKMNDNAQWANTELGGLGRTTDTLQSIYGDNISENAEHITDSAKRTAAGLLGSLSKTKALDYLELKTGVLANPYSEVLFRGMNNRVIPFSWTFVPKNMKEALALQAIIHRFRFHQRPEIKYKSSASGNTSYLVAPSTFDIDFISLKTGKHLKWAPKISTCALTSIDGDFTPNGQYTVTKDGQFSAITLNLMFTELVLPTKDSMVSIDSSY